MGHLRWQKQTLLQLQLLVLSPTSDCGLAPAKAMYSHAVIWETELTLVNTNLAKKKSQYLPRSVP